jgi:hypothetical protein
MQEQTQVEIVEEMARKKGAELLDIKKYSDHKDDYFLHIVLVKWRGEYVTWLANTQGRGFGNGHYFHPEYENNALTKAIKDFHKRGFYQQPQTETMLSY